MSFDSGLIEEITDRVLLRVQLEIDARKQELLGVINQLKVNIAILENQVTIIVNDFEHVGEYNRTLGSVVEAIKIIRDYIKTTEAKLDLVQREYFNTKLDSNRNFLEVMSKINSQEELIKTLQKDIAQNKRRVETLEEFYKKHSSGLTLSVNKETLKRLFNNKLFQKVFFIFSLSVSKYIVGLLVVLGLSQLEFLQDIINALLGGI